MSRKRKNTARLTKGRDTRGPLQRIRDREANDNARVEPTSQRLQQMTGGEKLEYVDPAKIDSSEQPIGRTPHIRRVSHLDRWHTAGVITQRQWWAGDAYRKLYEGAQSLPRVVASYGERTTGGELDYGLARTDAQARRRVSFRHARSAIPVTVVGMLDRMILRNDLPGYRGRAQQSAITDVRNGLDELATHFERRRADESLDDRNVCL
jgi:hypothetical protein